jgi:hypothetical protein
LLRFIGLPAERGWGGLGGEGDRMVNKERLYGFLNDYEQMCELYLLREKNLIDLTDIVNLRKENFRTSSLRFYDFILSASPLLENSANLFFEMIGLLGKGDFMANESRFRKFLCTQRKNMFQIKKVELNLKNRSFFDDPPLVMPFDNLESTGDHKLEFWKLYNKTKHGHEQNQQKIFEQSTLENALRCLGSSYLFLGFITYELDYASLRSSNIDSLNEKGWVERFYFQPDVMSYVTETKAEIKVNEYMNHPFSFREEGYPYRAQISIGNIQAKSLPPSQLFGKIHWPIEQKAATTG